MTTPDQEMNPRGLTNIKRNVTLTQSLELEALFADQELPLSKAHAELSLVTVHQNELIYSLRQSGIPNGISISQKEILEPAPDSALQPLDRQLLKVDYRKLPYGRKKVVAIVDDKDGVLAAERKTYLNRAGGKLSPSEIEYRPLIALGTVKKLNATAALLDEITSRLPQTFHLQPVGPFSRLTPEEVRLHTGLVGMAGPHTPIEPHRLPVIPQGFIDSLRRSDSPVDEVE